MAKSPKILITGSAGFLSLHLIEKLAPHYQLVMLARNREKFLQQAQFYGIVLPHSFEFLEMDIDQATYKDLMGADLIVHNAGRVHNLKRLPYFMKDNVEASIHLLSMKIPMIYTSTLSVFEHPGIHHPQPITELPSDPYARSKAMVEQYIEQHSCDAITVRPGLLCPCSTDPVFPPNYLLKTFFDSLKLVNCYPEDYQLNFVDITPVDRAADEYLEIIRAYFEHRAQPIYHVASAQSLSNREIVEMMQLSHCSDFEHRISQMTNLGSIEKNLLMSAFYAPQKINIFESTGHNWCTRDILYTDSLIRSYIDVP